MHGLSLADQVELHFQTQRTPPRISYQVALQLQQLKQRDHIGIEDVAKLIYEDQALSARILQIVNSAAYRGTRQVETLKDAVVRLGINRVASFSMLAAQMLTFRTHSSVIAERLHQLHRRVFAAANCAHRCAECSALDIDPEQAFLGALLKDVGALQILQILGTLADQNDRPIALASREAEIDQLVADKHASIGYRLMCQWGLPEHYAQIARDHDNISISDMTPLMAVVRLTDQLLDRIENTPARAMHDRNALRISPEVTLLGLSEPHLDLLERHLLAHLRDANEII